MVTKSDIPVLVYDESRIRPDLLDDGRAKSDPMADYHRWVAVERMEEVAAAMRLGWEIRSGREIVSSAEDLSDRIVLCRHGATEVIDAVAKSALYGDGHDERYDRIVHWWRHVPPKREVVEFSFRDLYESDRRGNIPKKAREILGGPCFIKTVEKQRVGLPSSWKGDDWLDALGYSFERVPLEAEMLCSKMIAEPFREFRCWVVGGEVVSVSLAMIDSKRERDEIYGTEGNEAAAAKFLAESFAKETVGRVGDLFPPVYVLDVLVYERDGECDIVEFNPYETSGRFYGNDVSSLFSSVEKIGLRG